MRIIVTTIFLIFIFFEISGDIVPQHPKIMQDTLKSTDSVYLRTSDFTCDTIEGAMIICTITEEKRDSILKSRRNILRKRRVN